MSRAPHHQTSVTLPLAARLRRWASPPPFSFLVVSSTVGGAGGAGVALGTAVVAVRI